MNDVTKRIAERFFSHDLTVPGFFVSGPHEFQGFGLGTLGQTTDDVLRPQYMYVMRRDGLFEWCLVDQKAVDRFIATVSLPQR